MEKIYKKNIARIKIWLLGKWFIYQWEKTLNILHNYLRCSRCKKKTCNMNARLLSKFAPLELISFDFTVFQQPSYVFLNWCMRLDLTFHISPTVTNYCSSVSGFWMFTLCYFFPKWNGYYFLLICFGMPISSGWNEYPFIGIGLLKSCWTVMHMNGSFRNAVGMCINLLPNTAVI